MYSLRDSVYLWLVIAQRLDVVPWLLTSYTIRQLFMSATSSSFSYGQARPCVHVNCPVWRPDSPLTPTILPSSVSLYSRSGSESITNRYCVGPLVMHIVVTCTQPTLGA